MGFQADILKWLCGWLILSNSILDRMGASSSQYQFENPPKSSFILFRFFSRQGSTECLVRGAKFLQTFVLDPIVHRSLYLEELGDSGAFVQSKRSQINLTFDSLSNFASLQMTFQINSDAGDFMLVTLLCRRQHLISKRCW